MSDPVSRIVEPVEVVQEEPEGKVESSEPTTEVTPPLPEYQSVRGHPYTVEFFKMDTWDAYNNMTDVDHVKDRIQDIETYVQNEIKVHNLENTVDSYKEIMNKVVSGLSLSDNEMPDSKILKIANYVMAVNGQRARNAKRKEILRMLFGG